MPAKKNTRPDHVGTHRREFDRNRRRIMMTQTVCGICGKEVDKRLKPPDPMSPCIDHIIPLSKGGHPSAMENLQLAHMCCNRKKEDRLMETKKALFGEEKETISNRNLPQSMDWAAWR